MFHSRTVSSRRHGDFTNIIFLHRSTGRNLIEQGGIRESLSEAGYSLWDHGYRWHDGLKGPDGNRTGYFYNIQDDNTDPDGLAGIFSQKAHGLPPNALSGLLQHEVIIFKSCFPVSHIAGDEQLRDCQTYYFSMRQVMDGDPDRPFIIVTPPPPEPSGCR